MDTARTQGWNNERDNQFSGGRRELQSFLTRQQSRHTVLDIESSDDDYINDNKYSDLIDNYKLNNNVVHNIYIDHIDKHDNDSGFHHHHRTRDLNDLNILYHNLDNHYDRSDLHDHEYIDTDDINTTGNDHYQYYGAAKHDHNDRVDGVAEHWSE